MPKPTTGLLQPTDTGTFNFKRLFAYLKKKSGSLKLYPASCKIFSGSCLTRPGYISMILVIFYHRLSRTLVLFFFAYRVIITYPIIDT